MSQLVLVIKTDNSVFDDAPDLVLAELLRNVANDIEGGETSGNVRDPWGNTVGSFTWERDEESDEDSLECDTCGNVGAARKMYGTTCFDCSQF